MQVSDTESESEESNEVGAKRLQDDAADINRLRKKYKNEIPKIPNSIVSSFLTQIDEKKRCQIIQIFMIFSNLGKL